MGNDAGTTPDKHTDPMQNGSQKPDRAATPCSKRTSSDDNHIDDEELVRCCLEWLGLHPDYNRMLHNERKMLAYHQRNGGTKQYVSSNKQYTNTLSCSQRPRHKSQQLSM
jgi:hypothetical protein